MNIRLRHRVLLAFLTIVSILSAQDVENELQSRIGAELNYELGEQLDLSFSPEFRLDEDYALDEYHMNLQLEYKVFDMLSVGAKYGVIGNIKKNSDTEYLGRYSLNAVVDHKLGRFTPSFRLMYSNYADDEEDDKQYLRYRAGVKYNIKSCKITPYALTELFHNVSNSELHKMRYSFGASYKLMKNNSIKLGYKLDYFYQDNLNKHIVELSYKYKF